jgi:hypothetical protein
MNNDNNVRSKFKLSAEQISIIEEKVNNFLDVYDFEVFKKYFDEVSKNSGLCPSLTEDSYLSICEIVFHIEKQEVKVIDQLDIGVVDEVSDGEIINF